MTEADILERLDAHLAHNGTVLERIDEEMRATREFHRQLHTDTREYNGRLLADFRQFTRDMIVRMERLGREEALELRRLGEEQRAFRDEQKDLRAESRAQTQALLRMIDRLGPGGAAA